MLLLVVLCSIGFNCLAVKGVPDIHNELYEDKDVLLHSSIPENIQHHNKDVHVMATCDGLSEDVGCTNCSASGHCLKGHVPIDPWMDFALKTQREMQIDVAFNKILMFDAHNAYNTRADGYGGNDTCNWPPPYEPTCLAIANHEFTLTDLLNMGVRALELDNWWCFGAMRLAHLIQGDAGCQEHHRLFSDGIREIGDWLSLPKNNNELVRIYMNEKQDQGHDSEVNDPIELYLGDKILTPLEFNETYGRQWPTMRKMRQDGNQVVIAAGSTAGSGEFYTHGDVYIHKIFWEDIKVNQFTPYPECGNRTRSDDVRFYSDSTKYGRAYDGTKQTGTILDFAEYVKCDVNYPGADQINPELMKTGIYTWAEGEPAEDLTQESCVVLDGTTKRWHVAPNCNDEHFFACQSSQDPDDWTMGTTAGPFTSSETYCPDGYHFSIPQDGYRHQKLLEATDGVTVWLDYTPWLPGATPTDIPIEPTTDAVTTTSCASLITLLLSALFALISWT